LTHTSYLEKIDVLISI